MAQTYYVTSTAVGGGNGLSAIPNGSNKPFTLIEAFTTGILEAGSTVKIVNSGSYTLPASDITIVGTGHATGYMRYVGVDYVNYNPIPFMISGIMATGSLPKININTGNKITQGTYSIFESLNIIGSVNSSMITMNNYAWIKDSYIENQGGTAYFLAYAVEMNFGCNMLNSFIQSDASNASCIKLNSTNGNLYNNYIWQKGNTSGSCCIFTQQSNGVYTATHNVIRGNDGVVHNVGAYYIDINNTYIVNNRARTYNNSGDTAWPGFIIDGIVCDAVRTHDALATSNKGVLNINTLENRVSNGPKGGAWVATGINEMSISVSTTGLFIDINANNYGSSIASPAFKRSYVYNKDIGARQSNRGGRASHL